MSRTRFLNRPRAFGTTFAVDSFSSRIVSKRKHAISPILTVPGSCPSLESYFLDKFVLSVCAWVFRSEDWNGPRYFR